MDKRKNTKSSRKDRSRALILDAADSAFKELGYDNVSMAEIAQRAGLTRMTVYNLFETKPDIVHAIGYRVAELATLYFQPRIEANEPAQTILRDAFMGSAQWCLDNPTIAPITLMGPRVKQLAPPTVDASFHAIIRDIFLLGQRQGVFRADEDANAMALILLGGYAQLMLFALGGGPFDMSRIDLLLRLSFEGTGPRPSSK